VDEGSAEPDIVEQGGGPWPPLPAWRPSRGAGVLAAVALAAGLAIGYAAGHGQARATAAAGPAASPAGRGLGVIKVAAPATAFPFDGLVLTQDSGTCSTQAGRDLDLGIPITNLSGETIRLEAARPVLFLSGMISVLSWHWGPCGLGPGTGAPGAVTLGPGEGTWLTATVRPLIACPAASPLQFRVTYSLDRRTGTVSLLGFPDLGSVSSCPVTIPPVSRPALIPRRSRLQP
jgi:hypothetical protein